MSLKKCLPSRIRTAPVSSPNIKPGRISFKPYFLRYRKQNQGKIKKKAAPACPLGNDLCVMFLPGDKAGINFTVLSGR